MHPQLNIAISAARSAGKIITRAIDNPSKIEVSLKSGNNDYVTSIDQAAEREIIKVVSKAYPSHIILGEESSSDSVDYGSTINSNECVWIIDPLDGTMNFVHGIPHFAVSIAVMLKGVLIHGVVYDPIRDELFTASKGSGAQLNGRKIRVSACRGLEHALLSTGFAYKRKEAENAKFMQTFTNLLRGCADMRRAGAAALDLAYVAAGRLDGFWETNLQPWDTAAGALLVREAGGMVGSFSGDTDNNFLTTGEIIAASPKVFPTMVQECCG